MISIICICNQRKVYNQFLKKSLDRQHQCSYELLVIDNSNHQYSSAAYAFNQMAKKAKGDLLMFVHQDMELCDDYFLNKVDSIFKENDNLGIVGILGRKDDEIIGNMNTLTTNSLVSPHHIDTLTTVNSLDECLFVIPKSIVLEYPFDERVCHHWHLYAVEYCYHMKSLNKTVAVLPLDTYHASYGDFMNEGYYQTLERLAKKYHHQFKKIDTTIRSWPTNPLLLKLNIQYLRYKKG